jgi:hypothetical protein
VLAAVARVAEAGEDVDVVVEQERDSLASRHAQDDTTLLARIAL